MGDENVGDLTVEILRQIRDEIRGLRQDNAGIKDEICGLRGDVGQTNTRLDRLEQGQTDLKAELSARLEQVRTDLKAELVTQGLKTAEGFVQVAHELDGIRHLLAEALALDERVEAIERRLDRAGIGR